MVSFFAPDSMRSSRSDPGRRRSRRPHLEPLEDRRLLSGPGSLDPTFGTGGIVTTAFSGTSRDSANTVLYQPDGKLIAVGTNMARYNSNGTLDTTFGKGGKVASVNADSATLYPPGTTNAGKIVVVGFVTNRKTGNDFTVTRYNANGSVDASFGSRGTVTTDLGGSDVPEAVAVQPDGKIIVAGDSRNSSRALPDGFGLARYNANGTLDSSFGSGGSVVTPLWGSDLHSLALQSDGKIVVAARAAESVGQDFHFTVARYNANGTLDTGFGADHNGIVLINDTFADHPGVVPLGGFTNLAYEANGVAIQPDGKIIAVGETYGNSTGDGWLVARFDTAGNLDNTFGINGTTLAWPSAGLGWDQAFRAAVQPDGEIVVAGGTSQATGFYVGRFDATGTLDPTFGTGGVVRTVIGTGNQLRDMLLQPDGKIVVSGDAPVGSGVGFGLARYLGSATSAPTAARAPAVTTLSASPIPPASAPEATRPRGPKDVATRTARTGSTTRPAASPAVSGARSTQADLVRPGRLLDRRLTHLRP
jgi:uncharacterized delta-60 repeat protein